ncbi:MAG: hypothetical protein LBN42_04325 [Oscillospiraceae bacterium]|jgi:hypothetical protein|nr:hypothetical protein [Oscillospiraceae bacterium]
MGNFNAGGTPNGGFPQGGGNNNGGYNPNDGGTAYILAVISVILGILGVVPRFGILSAAIGLVLAVIARQQYAAQGKPGGLANTGFVVSIIGLVIAIVIALVFCLLDITCAFLSCLF